MGVFQPCVRVGDGYPVDFEVRECAYFRFAVLLRDAVEVDVDFEQFLARFELSELSDQGSVGGDRCGARLHSKFLKSDLLPELSYRAVAL